MYVFMEVCYLRRKVNINCFSSKPYLGLEKNQGIVDMSRLFDLP